MRQHPGDHIRRTQSDWYRREGGNRRAPEPLRDPNLVRLEANEVRQKRTPSNEWPEPIPLPKGLSPVAALDTKLLPAAIAPWVCDVSERMQCPPDYVGVSALVALGSVLGRKIGIRPQRKTDWFEVANLWGLIVGRPGVLKSPAIHEALKPLHRLEATAAEASDRDRAEYLKAHQEWKLRKGKEAAEQRVKAALCEISQAGTSPGPNQSSSG